MNQSSPRILESPEGDFYLRQLQMEDADEFYTVYEANRPYLSSFDQDFTTLFPNITAVTKELSPAVAVDRTHFGIMHEGEFAGGVGFYRRQPGVAELFYWIDQRHTGQGLASRAGSLVTHNAFDTLHLKEVRAITYEGNVVSQRVAQKMGFTLIRKVYDELHFALRAEEVA